MLRLAGPGAALAWAHLVPVLVKASDQASLSTTRCPRLESPLKMSVVEGQLLAGKYRVERVLGVGGMGIVVAALHIQLDERVALKFLLPEALGNGEAVARFAREARAAVKIKSEHVARVSDVGTLDDGAPYMVMEYLDGVDLCAWLTQRGALPIEQAVEFVLQACEAIAEAHTLGIVHRDLKPANLFIIQRPDGALAVKVLDFGISRTMDLGPSGGMTKTCAVMGSPLYMSPEQMQSSKDADARSDIWALGVVLYELISGRPPFQGEALPEVVFRVMSAPPNPLRVACPGVPPGLEAVVLKCLEKDPKQRYQDIGALALTLFEFAPKRSKASVERIVGLMQRAGMSTSALPLPSSSSLVEARSAIPAPQTMASWGQTAPPVRRRRVVLGVAVGGLLAVPIFALAGSALTRWGALGTAVTASAVALSAGAFAQQAPEPRPSAAQLSVPPVVGSGQLTLAVEPRREPASAPPVSNSASASARSADGVAPARTPGAVGNKVAPTRPTPIDLPRGPAPAASTRLMQSPVPVPPKPALAVKNPLKMHIE
jgi:eukaryotic-like serine/threonine-protein kinase